MPVTRKTALTTVERNSFEGNYFDSISYAKMFSSYKPHHMGVKSAELFSSSRKSGLINKKFSYFTVAKNNVHYLPGGVDDYSWQLVSNKARTFQITKAPTGVQIGKGKLMFKMSLNTQALMEPVLIKCEHPDAPRIRIIGQPSSDGVNSWEYTLQLQTGNPNDWIPASFLQEGREVVDCGTSVADELNQKYGGDYFDDMFKLQGWTGNFARKASFTDKFIRTDIGCRKEGRALPKGQGFKVGDAFVNESAVGIGYLWQQDFNDRTKGKVITKNIFIENVVARLEERLHHDREMSFEFGRLEDSRDEDTGRRRKDPAGWRQIVKDGHFLSHNGSLSLSKLEDYITNIFASRKNFSDRTIKIATGEGGFKFIHRMIASEASQFQVIDTIFVKERSESQVHSNELEYGAQFTKIKLLNGIVIELVYDPIKDDESMFPERAPGSYHSVESFCMDIFDFGVTDQTPQGAGSMSNIACVMQDGVEEFVRIGGIYDFETGAVKDGSMVNSSSKEVEVRRATSGGLAVWDTSRIGRIEYRPATILA